VRWPENAISLSSQISLYGPSSMHEIFAARGRRGGARAARTHARIILGGITAGTAGGLASVYAPVASPAAPLHRAPLRRAAALPAAARLCACRRAHWHGDGRQLHGRGGAARLALGGLKAFSRSPVPSRCPYRASPQMYRALQNMTPSGLWHGFVGASRSTWSAIRCDRTASWRSSGSTAPRRC
jgi:hypothetical protein